MKLRTLALSALPLLAALIPVTVNADTPGPHPAYLHARSNLRAAQFLLRVREEPNVTRRLIEADHEVEAAIGEIDRAAEILDRKDIEDHPRVETFWTGAAVSAALSNCCAAPAPIWAAKKITAVPAAGAMPPTGTSTKPWNTSPRLRRPSLGPRTGLLTGGADSRSARRPSSCSL